MAGAVDWVALTDKIAPQIRHSGADSDLSVRRDHDNASVFVHYEP